MIEKTIKKINFISQDLLGDSPKNMNKYKSTLSMPIFFFKTICSASSHIVFPEISRSLKRRLADELGAIGGLLSPEEEMKLEPPPKRAKGPVMTNKSVVAAKIEEVPEADGDLNKIVKVAAAAASTSLVKPADDGVDNEEEDGEEED